MPVLAAFKKLPASLYSTAFGVADCVRVLDNVPAADRAHAPDRVVACASVVARTVRRRPRLLSQNRPRTSIVQAQSAPSSLR